MPSRRKRVSRNRLPQFQPAIEHLEDRTLLSGNVLVTLSGSGVLNIRGDDAGNYISIQQTDSGVQVSSLDSGATEINGSTGAYTASSTVKSIHIQMGSATNTVQIGDPSGSAIDLTGNLTISGSSGNNTISIANVTISKNLSITAGKGDNDIVIGSTNATAGDNPLTDVNLGAVSVGTSLSVSLGAGSNSVAFDNVSVSGKTSVQTGSGGDDVAFLTNVGATLSKSLSINTGSGADNVLLVGYTIDGAVSINTRGGENSVGFDWTTFEKSVTASGGAGGTNTYVSNAETFGNTFLGGTARLNNFQSQPADVTRNDSAFTDAFSWANDLLNAAGLLSVSPTAINQSFSTDSNAVLSTGNLLTSNTDPNGGTLAVASVDDSSGKSVPIGTATTLPSGALLTVNADGTFTYNPNGAFNSLAAGSTATETFTYSVSDSDGETSTSSGTVTITITGATRQNPVAVDDSFSTTEGATLSSGNLLTNDTDPNSGATLSVATVSNSSGTSVPLGTATTLPSGALLTVNANGTFTYNPDGAFDSATATRPGADTFTYTVSDNLGNASSAATVTISITPAQPVAVNDSFTTSALTPLTTGNLLTNDTDTNSGATLSVSEVLASDGTGITVGTATVLPSGAKLTVNSDGTFDYDPNGAFSSLASGQTASDGFTYSVEDSSGETSANFATVTITITGTQNPVAVNDTFTTDNATPLTTGNLLTNDFEPNSGATLSVATVHDASGNAITLGKATLLPSGALLTVNADGSFDYNPNGAFPSLAGSGTATDTFTYTITDSLGKTSQNAGTVTITVTATEPVAVPESFSTDELTPLTSGNLLTNDTDANAGATLSVSSVHDSLGNSVPLGTATTLPSGAKLTVNSNGTFTYDPNGAFTNLGPTATATDTFTYSIVDNLGNASVNSGTVTITISSPKPVAANDGFATDAHTSLTSGNILTNDKDANAGATLSVASVHDASGNTIVLGAATLLPSGAELTVNTDGTFTYNPNGAFDSLTAGETATDTFTYTVVDSLGNTSVTAGTVTISITPTRPVAVNDAFSTPADQALTKGNVLSNDTDGTPGATLSVASAQDASGNNIPLGTATILPSGALLTINADGTFNYNPNGAFGSLLLGQTATDTFTYVATDNFGENSVKSATVTITINGTSVP
jgi:VCBS repeat-containing protein